MSKRTRLRSIIKSCANTIPVDVFLLWRFSLLLQDRSSLNVDHNNSPRTGTEE